MFTKPLEQVEGADQIRVAIVNCLRRLVAWQVKGRRTS